MRKLETITGIYSVSHFIVDFSCAYLIFSRISGSEKWMLCLFTYNFFAFALQMPLGIIADRLERNRLIAAAGCVLIAFSPLLSFLPVLFCSVSGLGNALFHIGAGRAVLCESRGKFSALGIFVSPGALGIYFGTLWGEIGLLPLVAVVCVLTASAVMIWFAAPRSGTESKAKASPFDMRTFVDRGFWLMLMCLFIVVWLRSYVGTTLAFPWKGEGHYALYLVIAVVFGKALGGVSADRFGPVKTSCASLFLCAVLLLFFRTPACGVLAILLFNMTMPITLGAIFRILPEFPGFGFGILTFSLFAGLIPTILSAQNYLTLPYGYSVACIISAGLLYYGLRERAYAV
ncbi:MAG: hypothetical protein VB064_04655 [Oscillospiraceae bacterium]|nr:hypothetical protein [Oscillospiraceae bacterium]